MTEDTVPRRQRDREEWREIFVEFKRSGLSQQAFCVLHKIGLSTFQRWQQRMRAEVSLPSEAPTERPRLLPVRWVAQDRGAPSGVRIRVDDRFSVELDSAFEVQTLHQVLGVLESRR